jgi:mannose-1-phosphate guanylyltransferase/mannose-6-phosphate isomerase
MSTPPILPVVLCGGAGTRLWPLSTEARPKPFHAIGSAHTLFQETILRTRDAEGFLPPMVICGRAHCGLAEAQMAQIGVAPTALVLEPSGRGTAAVAAVAASVAQEARPGALVLLSPADHRIADEAAFAAAVRAAAAAAGELIVTFGVQPTAPATGYGYIERGEALADGIFRVKRFVEKPDAATAQGFLESGRYSWNAGIFLGSARTFLNELEAYRPDIAEAARAAFVGAAWRGAVVELSEASFAACPVESFDRAVMEHTAKAAVAPCDIGWADIGSWAEVWRLSQGDDAGNLIEGAAVVEDSHDCLVLAEGLPVAVLGVTGLAVVVTPEGVLVAPKARAQEVGALAGRVTRQGGSGGEPGA